MPRRLLPLILATGVIACSPEPAGEPAPAPEPASAPETKITPTAAADIPEAVRAAVLAARPGVIITEAELKEREGRRYYDVEGTLNGAEIELDMLETPQGWTVVEVQRDVAWSATPAAVRAAAETARAASPRSASSRAPSSRTAPSSTSCSPTASPPPPRWKSASSTAATRC